MLRYQELRRMVQSCEADAQARGQSLREARLNFVRLFHDTLGVCLDSRGKPDYLRESVSGKPKLGNNRAAPREVEFRELANAIMGHEFVDNFYHPRSGYDFNNPLTEAAIDPTAFVNVNTFNQSVAGLLNAEILDKFDNPEFIGDQFFTTKPTVMNGQKFIGAQRVGVYGSASKGRQPGEPHSEIGFGERYQTSPVTVEQAQKIKVTNEAVFFGGQLAGDILDTAGNMGYDLGYGREKDMADCFLGVVDSHNYGGTSYSTYQTTSPWVNDNSNAFTNEAQFNTALQLMMAMTDPDTGREILVTPKQLLVMPPLLMTFQKFFFGAMAVDGTNLSSTYQVPQNWMRGDNPITRIAPQLRDNIYYSQIWYNRVINSDGLNVGSTNSKQYWYIGDFKKGFYWMENWPLTPWQASPNELVMKDQGLVAVYGANYRGVAYAYQPRYSVRNKN